MRAVTVKKRAITPRRKSKQEQLQSEIHESVQQFISNKKTLRPIDIKKIMVKDVIIKTDEEKLEKLTKCPFIEPIIIYWIYILKNSTIIVFII